uniref:26S proteasome complex subunit SEM1 n=1 Tax=Suricata suricatta TaxID=37032 RepID=A0A673UHG3_SURSU
KKGSLRLGDLGLITQMCLPCMYREDHGFEGFPADDWSGLDEGEGVPLWEDNWDDENVEGEFSCQLGAGLEKRYCKMETL